MANRTPRESGTRESAQRTMEWRPGSALRRTGGPVGV